MGSMCGKDTTEGDAAGNLKRGETKLKEIDYPDFDDDEAFTQASGSERLNEYRCMQNEPNRTQAQVPESLTASTMNAEDPDSLAALSLYGLKDADKPRNVQMLGPYMYLDSSTYQGEYKSGLRHGFGRAVYLDGSVYEGYWKDDLKHGKGIFAFADGEAFVGDFVNDVATGKGAFYYKEGARYEGQFERNMMHGKGVMTE